jgi:hypothetical protein
MHRIHTSGIRRAILIFFCGFIHLGLSYSQTTKLLGTVIDSTTNPMISATVVLVQPVDSVMVSFAITNGDGGFVLNKISPGDYLLQITYIGYGNYQQSITVNSDNPVQDLGTLFLSPQNTLLEQVVVKAEHVPIVIKKDTVEYNADAFKTKPNAVVEDLLKRLPGIEVERDGNIKAQGEDVENVLVDGKEFFGKDPKIATQNLPADILDKVQVYNKKSEMAEFSGIEDGNDEKTINLTLKEDKKKGYFGNVTAGFGTEDLANVFENEHYEAKISVNRFDSRVQFSLLGMANDINDQGFSFNDYINFMGGMGGFMGGGKLTLSMNTADSGIPLGYNSSPGINKTAAGGLNFNVDINDKTEWQSSYFLNRLNNFTAQMVSSENLAGDKSFSRLENSEQNNTNLNHRLSTSLRYKLDSSMQITWINRLSFNTGDFMSTANSQSFDFGESLENESLSSNENNGDQFSWMSDLALRKRLNKPGRIVTAKFNLNLGDVDNLSLVNNTTTIYDASGSALMNTIFQDQESEESQSQYGISLGFTEPILRKTYLNLTASRSNYTNDRVKNYYDLNPNDPSSRILNIELSNQYKRNYTYDRVGTDIKINRKALNLTAGLSYQHSNLDGDILSENTILSKSFNYLLPSLQFDYEFSNSRRLDFRYRTRVEEPNLEQLQPQIDNTDPLNLYKGNPELKPAYVHEANIHLMIFDQFTFTNFFANINSSYTLNRIVNKTSVDEQFRQIVEPINVDHDWSNRIYASFGTPLRFMKSKMSMDFSVNYNRGILFVNELKNNTDRWTNNFTFTLENRKKENFDIAAGFSLGTNRVKYSESDEFNQSYFDQTYFVDLNLYLPNAWTFESSFDYTKYSSESFADKDELPLLRASITKGFLKGERASLELSVFDILNQNKGINRSNSINYIQESRTNVLGRFMMLSFNYKLSQFGGGGLKVETQRR